MAKILVVDDDPAIRGLVTEVLSMAGHAIEQAADGKEAIDKLKAGAFELMVIDRNMPIMNGVEAITLVRSVMKNAKIKIIMLTSASVIKEVDEAYAAGANGYLIKPINIDQLAKKIESTLKA